MLQLDISFLISSLMLLVLSVSGTKIQYLCPMLSTLTTPYELNVNSLFASKIYPASVSNFNTFEVPLLRRSQSSAVYGLFQCQGDLNSECKDCVTNSISHLRKACPVSIGGIIQLEGCLVKYDNTSYIGVEDKTGMLKKCGPSVGYNSDISNSINNTLANLIAGNGQYFHKGEFGSLHGVAQCVHDLSVTDCQDCLSETSGRLKLECESSSFGDMYLGKCYIRYTGHGNDKSNFDSRNNHNELTTNIIVQATGNAIDGVVTAVVSAVMSAVVSLFTSTKVAEAKVEHVKNQAKAANDKAVAASQQAKEANDKAVEAISASDTASQASKEATGFHLAPGCPPYYEC